MKKRYFSLFFRHLRDYVYTINFWKGITWRLYGYNMGVMGRYNMGVMGNS